MRVDERGREREPFRLDDAVGVRVEPRAELRNRPFVDPDVQDAVHLARGIEHPRAPDDQVLALGSLREQHQATSVSCAALTPMGPLVSRS